MITLCLLSCLSWGQGLFEQEDSFLPVEKAYQVESFIEGRQVELLWTIAEGYYLYRHQLKLELIQDGQRSKLDFEVPSGKKKYDEIFEEELEVYYHNLNLSALLPPNSEGAVIELHSQGCADAGLCYPPRKQWFKYSNGTLSPTDQSSISTQVNNAPVTNAPEPIPSAPDTSSSLIVILIGALVGGMILNLMPCVFPVLSLKALTLSAGNAKQHRINGWAYTAGVVASFLLVAFIISIAKSAGAQLGWGFQLQQPIFVACLVYLFVLLALNLFGLFEIGTSLMGLGQNLVNGNGVSASFFTGVLAAVVASPCTAPFMASAIGFTLSQSMSVSLLVFFCLGFGMALPYLLLSHSPALSAKLPKPGPWMEHFKQFLAFPLLLTAAWLLAVVGEQTSAYASALLVGGSILLAMALWLLNKSYSPKGRWLARAVAALLVLIALHIVRDIQIHGKANAEHWQSYSPELLEELRQEGQAVFIDLTADWCITCKLNERVALNIDSVQSFARDNNIAMLQGDWTSSDPQISALLHRYGRNGVPLYLMYPANSDADAEILPQILSPSLVIEAMERATETQ
ncbi:protein-disulfide reductase DsbD family protein [Agaribacterium sp. ZY112]|uniref:protein-disulfide reductase DsbD family protein n=1 Tax=Agaribacterium sp. ZY112 TaxID=3233574 RepID=UPI0035260FEC